MPTKSSSTTPQLRPSQVPWLDLEMAVNATCVLADLLSARLCDEVNDPAARGADGAGVANLVYLVNANLRARYNDVRNVHIEERKIQ